jgi:hypothetical protein
VSAEQIKPASDVRRREASEAVRVAADASLTRRLVEPALSRGDERRRSRGDEVA